MSTTEIQSDEALVAQVLEGDKGSFSEIYDRYYQVVYYKCLTLSSGQAEAQDLCHDIFIKIFVNLSKFRGDSKFSLWVKSIATNHCYDYLKQKGRIPIAELISEENGAIPDVSTVGSVWTDDGSAEEPYLDALSRALSQLDPSERVMVLMQYQDEMTVDQIAVYYSLGHSAVKMRLMRIRNKLATLIKTNMDHET